MLKEAVCQHERPIGAAVCVPLTTHKQDVVLKDAVSQHKRPVGGAACIPLTTHEQDVVLKEAVCQHERPVGAAACAPLTSHEQDAVLKEADCQHERPVGCTGVCITVTVAVPVFTEPIPNPVTDTIEYAVVTLGLTVILIGLAPVAE